MKSDLYIKLELERLTDKIYNLGFNRGKIVGPMTPTDLKRFHRKCASDEALNAAKEELSALIAEIKRERDLLKDGIKQAVKETA